MSEPVNEDLGIPVSELQLLEIEPQSGFRNRLRTRIERRRLAGSSVDLAIPALAEVLREFLELLFAGRKGGRK